LFRIFINLKINIPKQPRKITVPAAKVAIVDESDYKAIGRGYFDALLGSV